MNVVSVRENVVYGTFGITFKDGAFGEDINIDNISRDEFKTFLKNALELL